MRESNFKRLIVIQEDDEKKMNRLDINDNFLYGKNVIGQIENKKVGDPITYYQIINKIGNSVEYVPIYDIMEKNIGEEK